MLAAFRKGGATGSTDIDNAVDRARDRLLETETEWCEFQKDLAGRHPVSQGVAYPLGRIQKALPENTAIIGWLDVERKKGEFLSWIYVLRKEGPVNWLQCGRTGEADPFIEAQAFRRSISSPTSGLLGTRHEAKSMCNGRMSEMMKHLEDVESLIVIPSGPLLGIPIEAFVDNKGKYLCDKFTISYAPSATIYTWLTEKSEPSLFRDSCLLIGDPVFSNSRIPTGSGTERNAEVANPGTEDRSYIMRGVLDGEEEALSSLPRLPASRAEVEEIAALFDSSTVLLGRNASERNLFSLNAEGRLASYSVIHIATHALMDDMSPQRSAFVLSLVDLEDPVESALKKERIFDGLVTTKEILDEWQLGANLVTLSACETGLGRKVGGEGYIGFSHAFFQAGAQSLLVSLWKVEDRATSLLMRNFYELYTGREGKMMSAASALRKAKAALRDYKDGEGRRPYEHPYYWAAFILIGDRDG